MSTKKRILVTLIVAVLVGIVIFPMLPLEYRAASSRCSPTRCTTWAWVTDERSDRTRLTQEGGGIVHECIQHSERRTPNRQRRRIRQHLNNRRGPRGPAACASQSPRAPDPAGHHSAPQQHRPARRAGYPSR